MKSSILCLLALMFYQGSVFSMESFASNEWVVAGVKAKAAYALDGVKASLRLAYRGLESTNFGRQMVKEIEAFKPEPIFTDFNKHLLFLNTYAAQGLGLSHDPQRALIWALQQRQKEIEVNLTTQNDAVHARNNFRDDLKLKFQLLALSAPLGTVTLSMLGRDNRLAALVFFASILLHERMLWARESDRKILYIISFLGWVTYPSAAFKSVTQRESFGIKFFPFKATAFVSFFADLYSVLKGQGGIRPFIYMSLAGSFVCSCAAIKDLVDYKRSGEKTFFDYLFNSLPEKRI